MVIRIFLFLLFLGFSFSTVASAEVSLKAAFIRDHQLWLKEGDKETQLTKGTYASNPQWSKDVQFIAYTAGDKHGESTNLFIYDVKKKQSYLPYISIETGNYKQSPTSNQLDNSPQVVGSTITWYRTSEKENKADVWIKDRTDGLEHRWLKNVDDAPTFFDTH